MSSHSKVTTMHYAACSRSLTACSRSLTGHSWQAPPPSALAPRVRRRAHQQMAVTCVGATDVMPTRDEGSGGPSTAAAAAAAEAGGWGRPRHVTFEDRCRQVEAFMQQHGHCRVPRNEPTGLGSWVIWQRCNWKMGRLTPARQQRLAAVGLTADAYQDAWSSRFRQLSAFHSQHGHCVVLKSPQTEQDFPGLYGWLHYQRTQWRLGTLPDDRRRRLEGLKVQWALHDAAWGRRFQDLLEFRQEYGHTLVPARWPPNQALAYWVQVQRRRFHGVQGNPLTPEQQSRLLACGFVFTPMSTEWDRRYAELCEVKLQQGENFGLALLPSEGGLGDWAAVQRVKWRLGKLAPGRVAKLEALGFPQQTRYRRWQDRVAALDQLIAALGFPAAHALLMLAPARSAPGMAEEAVRCMQGSGQHGSGGGGSGAGVGGPPGDRGGMSGPGGGCGAAQLAAQQGGASPLAAKGGAEAHAAGGGLTSKQAADVVRWHRALRADKAHAALLRALLTRGLPPAL